MVEKVRILSQMTNVLGFISNKFFRVLPLLNFRFPQCILSKPVVIISTNNKPYSMLTFDFRNVRI
jgi:hypothetical protein